MTQLNITERKKLKSAAHHLKPLVQIGQKGLTDTLMKAVEKALVDHELIKIKFGDFKEEKRELSIEIANELRAEIVSTIGNVVILYRKQSKTGSKK